MSTASKVAEHKRTWPDLYCHVSGCLWRVKHNGAPDTPCKRHPDTRPKPHAHLRGNLTLVVDTTEVQS